MNFTLPTKNIWFPTQKEPFYDPQDEEGLLAFKQYWKLEKKRCMEGFFLGDNQVYVSGWLYFHTVYWKIARYEEQGEGRRKRKVRILDTPWLRDLDWDIGEDFVRAEDEGKFYNLVGSRDFGKSIMAASRAGWLYTFFDNSEAIISAGAYPYIKLATDKIEDGLSKSHILMVNYEAGSNTMAANGTRPGFHLIDEEGTLPNLIGCIKDSDGCWW